MDRYYPLEVNVAANTTLANPLTLAVPLEDNTLVDVELIIPTGHQALTGVRVLMSQQQVLPWGNNSWIKGDNYFRVFDMNENVGVRTVSVQAYNTDVYNHTFYLKFHIRTYVVVSSGTPSGNTDTLTGTLGTGGGGINIPVIPPEAPVPPPPDIPPIPPPPSIPGAPGSTSAATTHQSQQFMILDG